MGHIANSHLNCGYTFVSVFWGVKVGLVSILVNTAVRFLLKCNDYILRS